MREKDLSICFFYKLSMGLCFVFVIIQGMNTPAYESIKENYELLEKEQLVALVHPLEIGLAHSTTENSMLRTHIALMNQRTFGRKSEAHPNLNQGDLFTQYDTQDDNVAAIKENQNTVSPSDLEAKSTHTKTKNKPVKIKSGRKPLPESLPREERVIDLENKTCQHCHEEMKFIGDAISEKLNYTCNPP